MRVSGRLSRSWVDRCQGLLFRDFVSWIGVLMMKSRRQNFDPDFEALSIWTNVMALDGWKQILFAPASFSPNQTLHSNPALFQKALLQPPPIVPFRISNHQLVISGTHLPSTSDQSGTTKVRRIRSVPFRLVSFRTNRLKLNRPKQVFAFPKMSKISQSGQAL